MLEPILKIEWMRPASTLPDNYLERTGLPHIRLSNLSFNPGETVVIAGHNGSGKTTVLETLFGLRREFEFSVLFTDVPLQDSHAEKRRKIGVCFQRQTFNEVVRVSDIIALHASIYSPPKDAPSCDFLKVEELARKKYGNLSGGEQQRVNLYFALAHDPLLFIADEPEKGLDEATLNATRKYLDDRARRARLNVIASHNGSLVGIAHRFLLMDSGKLKFNGPIDDALHQFLGKKSWEMKINSDDFDEGLENIRAKSPESIFRKVSENRVIVYRIKKAVLTELESSNLISSVEQRGNKPSELVVITEKREL